MNGPNPVCTSATKNTNQSSPRWLRRGGDGAGAPIWTLLGRRSSCIAPANLTYFEGGSFEGCSFAGSLSAAAELLAAGAMEPLVAGGASGCPSSTTCSPAL